MRPAKTQISLGIRPVWSESSLCAKWVAKDPRFLHADSEDSDQTGRLPRVIWVFAGRRVTLLDLSWGGSYVIWCIVKTIVLSYSGKSKYTALDIMEIILDQGERQTTAPSTTTNITHTSSQTGASVESKASIASAGKLLVLIACKYFTLSSIIYELMIKHKSVNCNHYY